MMSPIHQLPKGWHSVRSVCIDSVLATEYVPATGYQSFASCSVREKRRTVTGYQSVLPRHSLFNSSMSSEMSWRSFCSPDGNLLNSSMPYKSVPYSSCPTSSPRASWRLPRAYRKKGMTSASTSEQNSKIGFSSRQSYVKYRPVIPMSLTWNGKIKTFSEYQSGIEGFLLQVGADYLTKSDVFQGVLQQGESYFMSEEFKSSYGISYRQAKYDMQYLFGILLTTTRKKPNHVIAKYQFTHSFNGVLCWNDLLSHFSYGGCKDLRIEELENILQTPPDCSSPSVQLVSYLDTFMCSVMELQYLLKEDPFSDSFLKRRLLSNLSSVPGLGYLLQPVRTNSTMDFEAAVTYVREGILYFYSHL